MPFLITVQIAVKITFKITFKIDHQTIILQPRQHAGPLAPAISGLLVKSPELRLRLDRAAPVLRRAADDPSGMRAW